MNPSSPLITTDIHALLRASHARTLRTAATPTGSIKRTAEQSARKRISTHGMCIATTRYGNEGGPSTWAASVSQPARQCRKVTDVAYPFAPTRDGDGDTATVERRDGTDGRMASSWPQSPTSRKTKSEILVEVPRKSAPGGAGKSVRRPGRSDEACVRRPTQN